MPNNYQILLLIQKKTNRGLRNEAYVGIGDKLFKMIQLVRKLFIYQF